MISRLAKVFIIGGLAFVAGCASGDPRWGQFHGDFSSRGYQPVESGFALSSAWISDAYRITSSSPVIGKDFEGKKKVYVGTTDAELLAIREQDGGLGWKRSVKEDNGKSSIVSAPAVSEKGDIYVLSNHESDDGFVGSTLFKIDPFSVRIWSYPFPDGGFTTGSPRVVKFMLETLIFAYLTVGGKDDVHGELFILRDAGTTVELLARKELKVHADRPSGNGAKVKEAIETKKAVWDLVSHFPLASGQNGISLQDKFVDPTVAVLTRENSVLIAVADNLGSTGAYIWDSKQLSVLWNEGHDFLRHSSPVVFPDGLMAYGRSDGKVIARDIETGVKKWTFDAGQPVFATPAAPEKDFIFILSRDALHVLTVVDGKLVLDAADPRSLKLVEPTYASPALTENRLYISTSEMLTVTYDLKTSSHDTNFNGSRWSSLAIDEDGSVFAVASDGRVHKYQGTH